MYIEDVVIDGFKSYSTKVTVGPFDKQFNAITGLNGTGKSNILDSICFVLGISNLTQVRVDSLNQLVYKNGQAGVTKASVTVTFNNEDKSVSPLSYEKYDKIVICRQIVIGGRNRYILNGHNVQGTQIANLFHSVQLNVNNPHFLIMQGRITKVINMKPVETLSMIEEAAGTRMYESKKNSAKRMMEKKQFKVDEINRVLSEDIGPTLEKLAAERQNYMQWTSNQNEIDRLVRFCIAGDYVKWNERLENRTQEKKELEDTVKAIKDEEKALVERHGTLEKGLQDMVEQKEKCNLQEVDTEYKKMAKELASTESRVNNRRKNVQAETVNQTKEVEIFKDLENKIKETKEEREKACEVQEERNKIVTDAKTELEKTTQNLEAVKAGMNQGDDGAKSFKEELMETKSRLLAMAHDEERTKAKCAILEKRLKETESQLKTCNTEGKRLAQESEEVTKEVTTLEKRIEPLKSAEETYRELTEARQKKQDEIQGLRDKVDSLRRYLQNVDFEYDDPTRNFNRQNVKGKVATLFTVKDQWMQYANALEVVAGGRLFHVVVDTDETSKQLLQKGNLKKRVTIIPLNRIVAWSIAETVVYAAKKVAGEGEVFPSIEIVGYPREVDRAMRFVFGGTFLCDTADTAKRVAFHQSVHTKCVTKLGDVYDPAGIVTGGSAQRQHSILELMTQLSMTKRDLTNAQKDLEASDKALQEASEKWTLFEDVSRKLNHKQHELSLLKERSEKSEYARLANEVLVMKQEKQKDEEYIKNAPKLLKETKEKVKSLEHDIANFESTKDAQTSTLSKKIAELKKALKEKEKNAKAQKEIVENFDMQLENLEKDFANAHESQTSKGKKFEELQNSLQTLEEQHKEQSEAIAVLGAEKERLKEQMKFFEVQINDMTKEMEKIKKDRETCEVERLKLHHKIERFSKDHQEAGDVIKSLERKHHWINAEKQFFGREGTDFDFEKTNLSRAKKKLADLEAENAKIGRNLNKKVMNMFDKANDDYLDLVSKRDIIMKDKEKIISVMEDLDEKKKEAVMRTWTKVNVDFGSIFGTLLPGTDAKLEPPPNMHTETEITGLEIKVAFNGVWKQSLSELSGGQRSLLALSLVLALLRFRPAPMYILDEVDAALDLSHTQNIGSMIKQHFPNSQFIIVSLKKGMFDNANVLFRTSFVDGCSRVTRTQVAQHAIQVGAKKRKINQDKNDQEDKVVEDV